MPETFPVVDETTGALRDVPHYSVVEVAEMLHLHESTVRRLMRVERWPHMEIGNRAWFAAPDVTAALASMRRNDGGGEGPAEHPADDGADDGEPGPLGLVLPDDDEPGDPDPGGIR